MIEERGVVQYANPAYARLAGFQSSEEVVGKEVARLTVPAPSLPKKTGDGGRVYETLRFDFSHGRSSIGLNVVRDVSERRALESRLVESEKLEALGRLVGGVAHDFNNILTAMTLHSDLLRDQLGSSASEVAKLREASQRGTDLVRQLLTFARQHPATPQVVSISKTVSSLRAVIEPLLDEDIELVCDFSAGSDYVHTDPTQLQQIILNLVLNARDALPKGGRISIRTSDCRLDAREAARHGMSAGHYLCLVVEDNGCGMREEVRARIFEPFFTTKEHGGGTGLGMSMVYGIVKQAGGSVTVASKLGKGTRVHVLLPRVERPQSDETGIQTVSAHSAGAERARSAGRTLACQQGGARPGAVRGTS